MRISSLAGLGALCVLAAGCNAPMGGYGPYWGEGDACPSAENGPKTPSIRVPVQIVNHAPWGGQLNLKPQAVPANQAPGVCIDGNSGNIHTYHDRTSQVVLVVTFSREVGNLVWPPSGASAFQSRPNRPGDAPTAQVSPDQTTLEITIPANGAAPAFPYWMYYQDEYGNPQPIEPMILPH